jgi:quercetin dioxygenase-like cupin family protein
LLPFKINARFVLGNMSTDFVVDGTIEVLLNNVWQKLRKGEGLRFNANQAHGYRNKSSKKASFHNIIHYPKI